MFGFGLAEKNRKENSAPTFLPKKGEGFTLVEVTVVLAIIGLLITVVVINTGQSRDRGRDAAIHLALMQVRNVAELYYDENRTYDGVCDPDNTLSNSSDFGRIENYIIQQGGANTCRDEEKAYAVISNLNLGDCWCVDSQGTAREVSLNGAADCATRLTTTSCPQ